MLLAIAAALLIAQALSAGLIWRMQHERQVAGIANAAAFRLLGGQSRLRFDDMALGGAAFLRAARHSNVAACRAR